MSAQPRYHVSTVTGYPDMRQGRTTHEPGLSAHVLDTFNCHRVVGTFRSETRVPCPGARGGFVDGPSRGYEGAIREAKRLAAILNYADA